MSVEEVTANPRIQGLSPELEAEAKKTFEENEAAIPEPTTEPEVIAGPPKDEPAAPKPKTPARRPRARKTTDGPKAEEPTGEGVETKE